MYDLKLFSILPLDVLNIIQNYRVLKNHGKVVRKWNFHCPHSYSIVSFANHEFITNFYYSFNNYNEITEFDISNQYKRSIQLQTDQIHKGFYTLGFAYSNKEFFISSTIGVNVFDINGKFLRKLHIGYVRDISIFEKKLIVYLCNGSIAIFDEKGHLLTQWSLGPIFVIYPRVFTTTHGEIYVYGTYNCIKVFDLYGNLLREFMDTRIINVSQIIVGPLHEIFVTNYLQSRIEIFSINGNYKRTLFTSSPIKTILLLPSGKIVAALKTTIQLLE